jgi:hypothetical protein
VCVCAGGEGGEREEGGGAKGIATWGVGADT